MCDESKNLNFIKDRESRERRDFENRRTLTLNEELIGRITVDT